jgi:SAM-dependent methyltransferase
LIVINKPIAIIDMAEIDINIDNIDTKEDEETDMGALIDMVFIMENEKIYQELIREIPLSLGKSTSKKERDEQGLKSPTLAYGEIEYQTFGVILEKIKKVYGKPDVGTSGSSGFCQVRGGTFYDLGCGTGKPLLAAATLYPFDVCIGIEILEGLFTLSTAAVVSYNVKGKAKGLDSQLQTLKGDFLNVKFKDWRDGDVVFCNSTCFDDKIMDKLALIANGMKKGSFFITLTRRLPTNDFVVLEHELHRMSWGDATIFIHQKISEPRE